MLLIGGHWLQDALSRSLQARLEDTSLRQHMAPLKEIIIGIKAFEVLAFCGSNNFVRVSAINSVNKQYSYFTPPVLPASRHHEWRVVTCILLSPASLTSEIQALLSW